MKCINLKWNIIQVKAIAYWCSEKYLGEFQETLATEVQPLGYILLWNPIRKEAKSNF